MTVAEIIAALTPYTGVFPEAAVKAAIAQREEVTPHLLRALEETAETPDKFVSPVQMLHVYATFLLAQFRDQRAYLPLTRILAAPGEITEHLYGDTITEGLDRILASVYSGDPEPIKRLVEGDDVYDFVRGAAVDTFMVLIRTGQLPRQDVLEYFQELFGGKLHREHNQVWNALAAAVADLPAPELLPDVRKAFEDDLVDPYYMGLEEVEAEALVPFEQKESWKREKVSMLITDTISEMSWWAAFHREEEAEPLEPFDELDWPAVPLPSIEPGPAGNSETRYVRTAAIRQGPKIGRNDPCPCGSGKKYKKCCLH